MATTQDLQNLLSEYQAKPESFGELMQLNLADIILYHLRRKGWTQKQLAETSGIPEPQITRLVHAKANWTASTAGRVLHALGVSRDLVKLAATPPSDRAEKELHTARKEFSYASTEETHNGAEEATKLVARIVVSTVEIFEPGGGGSDGPKAPKKRNVA